MACGPKAAQRRAPGRVGLGRVLPEHGEEKALMGGARAAVSERGRRERERRVRRVGPGTGLAGVGRGKRKKKKGRGRRRVGPTGLKRGRG